MNFLGHLFLSDNDTQLMLNNLFGDFAKGKDLSRFPEQVQNGIRLHRQIDNYIDHHPDVLNLVHILQPQLPKVAAIAVDLFFDHLLAKNWNTYHYMPLNQYLNNFYENCKPEITVYGAEFVHFVEKLIQYNWISYYPEIEGLEKASRGVASRLSFSTKLPEARAVFEQHELLISQVFEKYMNDAIQKFNVVNSK